MSALDSDPFAINIRHVPKLTAAPRARKTGFKGNPCDSSGPLAKNAPRRANMTPIATMPLNLSPRKISA